MTLERPPRLQDGELGPILRAAEHGEMTPERLAENGQRIKALIAAGTATALWKLLAGLLLLGAIAVPVVMRLSARDDAPPPAPVVAAPSAPVDAAPAPPPSDAPAVVELEPDAAPPEPHHHVAPVRVAAAPADAAEVEATPPDAPPSDLPAEIALYNAARTAAGARDYATALARLDELLRRFPTTPLRADAELTRADVLARAGRLAEAAQAFEVLVRDDSHRGRRGELLRTLGDLYRQLHDCPHATDAYTRALAEHLNERDRADAERGRDRCTAR